MNRPVAIRSHKEHGFYRAVAVENREGFVEYSDANVSVQGKTRADVIKQARQELKDKGYKVVNKWEL